MIQTRDTRGEKRMKTCSRFPVCVILGLLFIVSSNNSGFSQELNPPYPRFGVFTFSGHTESSLDILKVFDIIAFPANNEMATKYKQQNPNVILLGDNAWIVAYMMDGPFPEEWYYHDINGERFELWDGATIMNITPLCPRIDRGDGHGPETFNEHTIHFLQDQMDFNQYDGVFHDFWWGGPGNDAKTRGDLNRNGVADFEEWGPDSVDALWRQGLINFHQMEYEVPGLDYVVVQIGTMWDIWPHINGACFEDWPIYNGPWITWHYRWNDSYTNTKEPKIMLHNSSISQYNNNFPTDPYKNNYRSVRFGLSSCLLTSSYFYVDEGNQIGHHGNIHIYDEFESKGQLGYPLTDRIQLEGKTNAGTNYAVGVFVRFFQNGVSVVNATGINQTVSASELAAHDPVGGSRYYRFQGGQDPTFNNGQEVTTANPLVLWGDTHMANWSEEEIFGDGAILFRTPKTLITPIIVDNHVNNQTSPGSDPVQYTGTWILTSDGGKYYAYYTGRDYGPFQPDAFAWAPPGSGNVATYTPNIGYAGMYEVFEWHGYRGSSPGDFPLSAAVPARITNGSTVDTTVVINQTSNFGQWNSLGIYSFSAGMTGRVELRNQTEGIVISDAIRFVYRGSSGELDTVPPSPPQGVRVIRLR